MKRVYRGIAVAALQCVIVLSVAAKYSWDRERLPRVWAKAAPVDPSLPIRGRYVSLRLEVDTPAGAGQGVWLAHLSADAGRLMATPDPAGNVRISEWPNQRHPVLFEPVAYFIPEHASDPSRRSAGEELWVEVSVPAKGSPRPIRLGVKKNGTLTPLHP